MKTKKPIRTALTIVQKYAPKVTKVVDATKPLTMVVTASDNRKANPKSPDDCALAKACKHTHDGAIISTSTAYIIDGHVATRYKVPESISREIVSFDRSHKFASGEYTLKAPTKTERLGPRRRPQYKKTRTNPKRRYVRNHKTSGIRSL